MRKRFVLVLTVLALVLAGASCGWAQSAAPASAPAPSTAPAVVVHQSDVERLIALTRASIGFIQAKRFDEAEGALNEALAIAPGEPVNLYNLACVKSLRGQSGPALDYLERAADAGFIDFAHIEHDSDLDSIRKEPRYLALMARREEFARRTAEAALAALKHRFGEKYIYEIDPASKLVFATDTDAETLTALKKWLTRQAASQWKTLFDNKPQQYIAVVLPSKEDFAKIVTRHGVEGFYSADAKTLIADRLGQVMTHEFTHAMQDADLAPLGQEHPTWLVEGLAVMYESAQFDAKDELIPAENFRLPYIQMAARQNRLIPLSKLLTMPQKEFVDKAAFAYGESGSFMLYLYEKGLLKRFYERYKETYDKDKTGAFALEDVTGQKIVDLDIAWRRWMIRRAPPVNLRGDGAYLGMRFLQANDGLKVVEVVHDGPGEKAGIQLGDLVVGMADLDVRDYQSFMPMLQAHRPGETLPLRVRRGTVYSDVSVVLGRRDGISTTAPAR